MKKTAKLKLILFVVLSIVGLIGGFFFSGLINLALTNSFKDISQLTPQAIIASVSVNKNHQLLLLCLELFIVSGVSIVLLMNKRETFESDVSQVTESIRTPISIGQGQHGSARWLKKSEYTNAFSIFRLDADERRIKDLLVAGENDRKAVKEYGKKAIEMETSKDTVGTESNKSSDSTSLGNEENNENQKRPSKEAE